MKDYFGLLEVLAVLMMCTSNVRAQTRNAFTKKRLGAGRGSTRTFLTPNECKAACQIHGVHALWEEEDGSDRPSHDRRILRRNSEQPQTNNDEDNQDVWFYACRTLWDESMPQDKYLPMHEVGLPLSHVQKHNSKSLEEGEWSLCFEGGSPQNLKSTNPSKTQLDQNPTTILAPDVDLVPTTDVLESGTKRGLVRINDFRHLTTFPTDNSHRSGTKTLLVVRVSSTTTGESPSASATTLKRAIFGPLPPDAQAKNYASVIFQYSQMSHGMLNFIPATFPDLGLTTGVLDIDFGGFDGEESIQFLSRDLVKATEAALNLDQVTRLQDVVHHTIFCLPDEVQAPLLGSHSDWTAFTYVYEPYSFYRLNRASKLSVVTHEIGHASLGYRHSGAYIIPDIDTPGVRTNIDGLEVVEDEYADETGYMGYSINLYGRPRKAFNAHKHWLTPWYNEWSKVQIENPLVISRSLDIELVGYAAYETSEFTAQSAGRKAVLIRIGDFFLQYNFVSESQTEDNWNIDTFYPNKVSIVQADGDEAISFLRRVMGVGESYVNENYKESGKSVVLGICPSPTTSAGVHSSVMLKIVVLADGADSSINCKAPILSPTPSTPSPPIPFPTLPPSPAPTKPSGHMNLTPDIFVDSGDGKPTSPPTRDGIILEREEPTIAGGEDSSIPPALAAALIGLIVVLFLCIIGIWWLFYPRRSKKSKTRKEMSTKETIENESGPSSWTRQLQFESSQTASESFGSTQIASNSPSSFESESQRRNRDDKLVSGTKIPRASSSKKPPKRSSSECISNNDNKARRAQGPPRRAVSNFELIPTEGVESAAPRKSSSKKNQEPKSVRKSAHKQRSDEPIQKSPQAEVENSEINIASSWSTASARLGIKPLNNPSSSSHSTSRDVKGRRDEPSGAIIEIPAATGNQVRRSGDNMNGPGRKLPVAPPVNRDDRTRSKSIGRVAGNRSGGNIVTAAVDSPRRSKSTPRSNAREPAPNRSSRESKQRMVPPRPSPPIIAHTQSIPRRVPTHHQNRRASQSSNQIPAERHVRQGPNNSRINQGPTGYPVNLPPQQGRSNAPQPNRNRMHGDVSTTGSTITRKV